MSRSCTDRIEGTANIKVQRPEKEGDIFETLRSLKRLE